MSAASQHDEVPTREDPARPEADAGPGSMGGKETGSIPPNGSAPAACDEPPTRVDSRGEWPTVPGYEIMGALGSGGMGHVFKARQVGLDRLIALKIIRKGRQAEFH